MNEQSTDPSNPPELQPVMDTEIEIEGLNSALDLPKLEAAVADVVGIASVSFAESKLAIRYDPERITKAGICDLIRQAGFHVAASEDAPAAPPIEPAGEGGEAEDRA